MKARISITALLTVATLLFSAYQPGAAAQYYNHDGSVDDDLIKKTVKPLKGHKDYWVYSVEACATDHTMKVSVVTLKSDMDKKELGVNKVIPKGDCQTYGAVMKAKDPNTLGASMLESHEALERMEQILKDMKSMSEKDRKIAHSEFIKLFMVTGYLPR